MTLPCVCVEMSDEECAKEKFRVHKTNFLISWDMGKKKKKLKIQELENILIHPAWY